MTFDTIALGSLLSVCLAATAQAQPTSAPSPEPSPSPSPASLRIGGFVDAYYAYNSNEPADHATSSPASAPPPSGTTRSASTWRRWTSRSTRSRSASGWRSASAPRPRWSTRRSRPGRSWAPRSGSTSSRRRPSGRPPTGRGLFEAGGIYPSHIGFEGFATQGQLELHALVAGRAVALLPDRASSSPTRFSEHWSGQLHVLNGWQIIGDNNSGKAVGTQIAYNADKLSASLQRASSARSCPATTTTYRVLGDVVLTRARPTPELSASAPPWTPRARAGPAARASPGGRSALYAALRPARLTYRVRAARRVLRRRGRRHLGHRADAQGVHRDARAPARVEHLILKLEGRYDSSSADVFAGEVTRRGRRPAAQGQPVPGPPGRRRVVLTPS